MMRYMKGLGALLLAVTLAACGGGGGSPGTTGTGGGATGGDGSGGGTTGGGTTASPAIALSIQNAAGTSVNNISSSGGFTARATVTDAAGAPQTGRLVTFALADEALATVTPKTALTDSSGVAQVSIAPTSLTAQGATTLTATSTVGTANVTSSRDFSISASNLALSAITVGSTSLASGGNTPVSVTATVNGAAASSTPVNVTFTASCGRINSQGASTGTTTDGNGVASATYTAVNADGSLCSGAVSLTASAAGASSQTATVTVAAPAANAITFVGANPQQIFVAGSGAFEQSTVTFRVLSGTTPLANQSVTFSLAVNPGGVGLNASGSTANVTTTTDANGNASVTVFSGSIPGPVQVRAQLTGNANVFAVSQNLSVSSGPPSQRFMSLSTTRFNIEGARLDGASTTLTVRIADRQGNPVQNGTVVNFTAEGGQVASSCQTQQVNGISSCSVDFISQNPRPADGRVSILAFTNGTKDYVDNNGNNRFDAGDTLRDLGDAYRDDNENNAFDAGEFVVPRGGAMACAGTGGPFPSRANTCDGQLATTVRQQTVILFSSSSPALTITARSAAAISFKLGSADFPSLPMPVGTTIAATTTDTTAVNNVACSVTTITPSSVVNVSPGTTPGADLTTDHTIALKDCAAGDRVQIEITSPSGLKTIIPVQL